MLADPGIGHHLSAPSISFGSNNLYLRGALEEETRPNLDLPISSLVDGDGSVLTVNDKKLIGPMRIRLKFVDGKEDDGGVNMDETS